MSNTDKITDQDLPTHVKNVPSLGASGPFEIPDDGLSLEEVEKKLIKNALNKAGGNKSKAAKFLGITRRKLYSMMDRLGGIQGLN